jgi:hypothetical protein
MIIVPALTKSQQRHPEAVLGGIVGGEPSPSPHMGRRVHQPGGVQANDRTEEDAPQKVLPPSDNEKDRTQRGNGHPVPPADPHVEAVFAKVRDVGQKIRRIVSHRPARQNPTHVGPETAVARGMRVTILVGALVMHTMCRDPKDRTSFQSQCAAYGKTVFHPLRRLVASMRKKPMVPHSDAETPGDPPKHQREQECLPAE